MTKQEYLFLLERNIELNNNLTDYEIQLVEAIINNLNPDIDDVLKVIESKLQKEITANRINIVLNELSDIFTVVNDKLQKSIEKSIPEVYLKALNYHADSLSLFRSLPINAAVTDATLQTIFGNDLLGYHWSEWVKTIYKKPIDELLRLEMAKNIDKSYPKMLKNLKQTVTGLSRDNLISLIRTFTHGANVEAQKTIYRNNPSYLKDNKVIWSAVLENGYKNAGRGTCLRCAGLDGNEYELDNHPPIPLHIRCRCVLLPKTKSWKELGLKDETINQKLRAYSLRENKNIDVGGRRKIIEAGQTISNDYGSWITSQSEKIQIQTFGPKRYELLKSGKVKFTDLVNPKTGELRNLDELIKD